MAKKSSSIEEFTIRAKSILLREDRGEQLHAQGVDKIDTFRSEGMTQKKATVLCESDLNGGGNKKPQRMSKRP